MYPSWTASDCLPIEVPTLGFLFTAWLGAFSRARFGGFFASPVPPLIAFFCPRRASFTGSAPVPGLELLGFATKMNTPISSTTRSTTCVRTSCRCGTRFQTFFCFFLLRGSITYSARMVSQKDFAYSFFLAPVHFSSAGKSLFHSTSPYPPNKSRERFCVRNSPAKCRVHATVVARSNPRPSVPWRHSGGSPWHRVGR